MGEMSGSLAALGKQRKTICTTNQCALKIVHSNNMVRHQFAILSSKISGFVLLKIAGCD